MPAAPKAEPRPLEETSTAPKIVDSYRWLEDGQSAETQKWVAEEMAYTRALLDPLPGREAIHKRLTELLVSAASACHRSAGNIISTCGGKECRTSQSLYVREGMEGKDRVLVDANQLAADGTSPSTGSILRRTESM